jgi:hypothetical protein
MVLISLARSYAPCNRPAAPWRSRCLDSAFLCAAAEQDDDGSSVLSEIDAVSRTPVELQFRNAFADGFHIRGIAALKPGQRNRHLGLRSVVKVKEPRLKRRAALFIDIGAKLEFGHMVP